MYQRDLNYDALEIVDEAIEFAPELGIEVHDYDSGATVLDFGVDTRGGIEAGIYYADVSAGGLASYSVETEEVGGTPMNVVDAWTDHPLLALLGSQWASWRIETESGNESDGYSADISGPATLLAGKESLGIDYEEDSGFAVACLESDELPPEETVEKIAEESGVPPDTTYALVTPTASTAGAVQTASRVSEVSLFRLMNQRFDTSRIETASGRAPVAPISSHHETVCGANDCIRYVGDVYLRISGSETEDLSLTTSSSEYSETYFDELYDGDLHDVDEDAFTPAAVTLDFLGGGIDTYGEKNEEAILKYYD